VIELIDISIQYTVDGKRGLLYIINMGLSDTFHSILQAVGVFDEDHTRRYRQAAKLMGNHADSSTHYLGPAIPFEAAANSL